MRRAILVRGYGVKVARPSRRLLGNAKNVAVEDPMKDEWNERLRCPKCGINSMASCVATKGAETATVERVPAGFKVVHGPNGPDFHCEACDVRANLLAQAY